MFTEIPTNEWRDLILKANTFANAKPWSWIDEGQVIGVVDVATGEKIYCSVMGRSGEMRGIALYPGKKGWWSYLQLGKEEIEADPTELVYEQRCIVLSFEEQSNADKDDLALMKHLGIHATQLPLIPSFRSYLPSYLPQTLDRQEVLLLQRILPQALSLLGEILDTEYALPQEGLSPDGTLLFRSFDTQIEAWRSEWILPDSITDFTPTQVLLSKAEISAAKKLPITEAIWLLEEFHVSEPVEDGESPRPFFPRALLFFDLEDQEFRGLSLVHPENWPNEIGEPLLEMLANQGCRPSQVVVSKNSNFVLFRAFCKALGISISLEEGMNILPELKEAVNKIWEK